MERERLFGDIARLGTNLKKRGVDLRALQSTARAMTLGSNANGATIEDLRAVSRELTMLDRSLRRRDASSRARIASLREWIGVTVFACAFGGVIAQKTIEEIGEMQSSTEVIAEVTASKLPQVLPKTVSNVTPLTPRSVPQTERKRMLPRAENSTDISEESISQTPRHLLGVSRITEPPIHQELGLFEQARYPETNEHGYVTVLLAGRRGIGQSGGGPLLDSIKEIIIDPVTGSSIIVNLPRDLAVTYRNRRGSAFRAKLNTVHQNAGMPVLKDIVAEMTGQPVTHEVIINLGEMEALSGELLKILGGRIVVEDPQGRHFWNDGWERYYPPRFELTNPQEIHQYVRFRKGYQVKPSYGERVNGSGIHPRPRPDEIVRRVGSSDGRDDRQSIFLQALARNLYGIGIFDMPALADFIENHFGIPKTTQARFAFLALRAKTPATIPTKYWSCPIIRSDGQTGGSTIAIDPNRIRRAIRKHLRPVDSVAAAGS